ncbi:hypothetical protein ElyMa_005183700 [Elysia marginata]|uniref:Uncharacterized protein n=1 Tax=Elysia marginata TaxID=1093978 RepID=A0AAV4JRW0_9GAST|nr:hypothetical protein ElyMa_005183700 [Elysia marginata]
MKTGSWYGSIMILSTKITKTYPAAKSFLYGVRKPKSLSSAASLDKSDAFAALGHKQPDMFFSSASLTRLSLSMQIWTDPTPVSQKLYGNTGDLHCTECYFHRKEYRVKLTNEKRVRPIICSTGE